VGRAIFDTVFLSFRFAAWESTGTSSVRSGSELDDESEDGSLFRFVETAGVDELTDEDDISLASGRRDTSEQLSTRSVSARVNLIYGNIWEWWRACIQYNKIISEFYVVVEAGESCCTFRDSASLASASRNSRHEWSTAGCFAASLR
jgi:hypothetical protein